MRFYDLRIINPTTNAIIEEWTSHPNGVYDPAALNVIFDCFVYPQSAPKGGSTISIEGIQPTLLSNTWNFSNMQLQLYGGMQAGLPLANPTQAGLLVQGSIFQAFGNWVGPKLSLDLVIYASPYSLSNPGNIVLNWKAGTSLQSALTNCFNVAFPKFSVTFNISDYVLSHDEIGFYPTLTTLAQTLSDIVPGLNIIVNNNKILVTDSTYTPSVKQLQFTDFIGQPMWIEPYTIQIQTTLRADIQVTDTIKMPAGIQNVPGFVQTTAEAYPSQIKYKSLMQGEFSVIAIRHIGNLRQPEGNAWQTVINAVALKQT